MHARSFVRVDHLFTSPVFQFAADLLTRCSPYFLDTAAVSENQVKNSDEWKAKKASSTALLQAMQNISRNAQLTFGKKMETLTSTWVCEKTQGFLEINYPQITPEVRVGCFGVPLPLRTLDSFD
jgi:hypothetical protein